MTTPPATSDPNPGADFARPMLERQLVRLERLADIGMEIAEEMGRVAVWMAQAAEAAARVAVAAAAAAESAAGLPAAPGAEAPAEGADGAGPVAPRLAPGLPVPPDPVAMSLAFGRISRAVRMTYVLQVAVADKLREVGRFESSKAYDARVAAERAAEAAAEAVARAAARRDAAEQGLLARKSEIAQALTGVIRDAHREVEGGEAHERCVREACERLKDADDLGDILSRPISEVIDQICRDLGLSPDWERLSSQPWALTERWSGKVGAPLKRPAALRGGCEAQARSRRRPGVGEGDSPEDAASDDMDEAPEPAEPPEAEPLSAPIPDPFPARRGRRRKGAKQPKGNDPPPAPIVDATACNPWYDPDPLPGYPIGLPGELPPERPARRRPDPWR